MESSYAMGAMEWVTATDFLYLAYRNKVVK